MDIAVMGKGKMAKKYIDANKFWNRLISVSENDWVGFDTIDEILSEMASVDVVEVVRCKDCIYHTGDDECTNGRWDNWGDNSDYELYPEALEMDYCSYGERRNG